MKKGLGQRMLSASPGTFCEVLGILTSILGNF